MTSAMRTVPAVFAAALAPGLPAQAEVYRVTGELHETDFVSGTPTLFLTGNVGTFELIIDEADLTHTVAANDPALLDPLEIEPWYGYAVTSGSVTMNGQTIVGTSFSAEPAAVHNSSLETGFYIEGVPIDQLTTQDIHFFVLGLGGSALIGHTTVSLNDKNVISNQFGFFGDTPASGSSSLALPGGGIQNLQVEVVPEPASAAVFISVAGVLTLRRRR